MIDANSKTNSFLKAIEKYAEEQKNMMKAEIEAFREEQLSKADEEGTAAAYAYIQKSKSEFKASLAKEISLRETEIKRDLFKKRNDMVGSIFGEAEAKLQEYVKSPKYDKYMKDSAKEISSYIGKKKSVVYISPEDSRFEKELLDIFFNMCDIEYDKTIKIGGLRCFCEELSIIADNTLDTKFEDKKKEFVSTSGFMIG